MRLDFACGDLGDAEEFAIPIGGAVEQFFAIGPGFDLIDPGNVGHVDRSGGGFDPGDIEFIQLLYVVQDAAQLGGELGFLGFSEFEAGEVGNFMDFSAIEHGSS